MKKKTLSALVSAIVVVVAALLGIPIYEEATAPEPTVSTVAPDSSFLMVHTIDVGQADCILIDPDPHDDPRSAFFIPAESKP